MASEQNTTGFVSKAKLSLQLLLSFMKIGAFTFGGGYAMIALFEREFVEKRKWIDHDEFLDLVAISESTPGPIAINSATYIGFKVAGFFGSLCATVGVVIPSFVIIYLISMFFEQFLSFELVAKAFRGVQVCVCYLILSAGIKLFRKSQKTAFSVIMFSVTCVILVIIEVLSLSFSSVYLILIGGVVGVLYFYMESLRNKSVSADNKKEAAK